jgi:hypothetical protein
MSSSNGERLHSARDSDGNGTAPPTKQALFSNSLLIGMLAPPSEPLGDAAGTNLTCYFPNLTAEAEGMCSFQCLLNRSLINSRKSMYTARV